MGETKHLADTLVAFFRFADHRTFTPFSDAVAGLSAAQAAADPGHGLHSVWATVNHVRFWIEVTWLLAQARPVDWETIARDGDWPSLPDPPTEAAWADAVSGAIARNSEVAALVEAQDDEALEEVVHAGYVTRWQVVQSLIAHNVYHTCSIIDARRALGLWP